VLEDGTLDEAEQAQHLLCSGAMGGALSAPPTRPGVRVGGAMVLLGQPYAEMGE